MKTENKLHIDKKDSANFDIWEHQNVSLKLFN